MNTNRVIASVALLVLASACGGDGPVSLEPPEPATISVSEYLALVRSEPTGDGVERIALVARIGGRDVASVQGELQFDPTRLTISSVKAASGEDGTSRFVNGGTLRDGRIRFAAFAPERLSEGVLLIIEVEGDPLAAMRAISAALTVVGDAAGRAVQSSPRGGVVR